MRSLPLVFALTGVVIASPALAQPKAGKTDFAHDVVPVLKARCAKCHTDGTYKGGLSLDTRESLMKSKAVVPGKSAESELVKRITSTDPDERMPPKGDPLTPKEVATLKAWVDDGATWESGFSFKPPAYVAPLKPRRPQLPPAVDGRDHPIDRILDAYFAANKVSAPPALDDGAFARRVFLDLIGQLPAPADLDAFLADKAPDRREKLVRSLLADNRAYSDHWLTFWNDLLRNDYVGTGYIDGGRKPITNWLYASLAENKPYDRFVRELIAPSPDSEGFAKGIKWRGAVNASQVTELQFAQSIGQVFFGANLKCASCHDSFIDAWKLDDAYGLAAVIADSPLEVHRCDKPQGRSAGPKFLFPELGTISATAPKAARLQQLAALATHPDNGRFSRTIANRLWHRLMGRGIVQPVDVMGSKPWSADLLDYLAVYLADNGYDLKKLIGHIVSSRAYQSRAVPVEKELTGDDYIFRGPELKRLTAEQFMDAVWQITGTAPAKPAGQMTAKLPDFPASTPPARRVVRASLVVADPLMRSLGRPNREQVVTTRPDQLSTLQALDLSNGAILADTLTRGAGNILKANPKATPDILTEVIYRQAFSREPTAGESAVARDLLGPTPTPETVSDLLWVVVMLPEFQLIR
ncbi:MAG: Planctomycete cytochrome [Gemmataceae bacterium]|nr:Planctomycete cytochrome [Gemmataceae bacterium]